MRPNAPGVLPVILSGQRVPTRIGATTGRVEFVDQAPADPLAEQTARGQVAAEVLDGQIDLI